MLVIDLSASHYYTCGYYYVQTTSVVEIYIYIGVKIRKNDEIGCFLSCKPSRWGLGGKGDAVIPNIGGSRGTASEKFWTLTFLIF